ncbi:hypothetical protein PHLGIDRAFT_129557 [Phlebiopsis gigantea 11061_1 CR5-6]|uniref:Uncharacterized protein n=1 Tax=Phlebiopsis gigantea (strain 11061_1 CR5-6) TaxID=745531 RepID=A0A0C3RU16_PHLG1|nr:hypothetical protein PHLGIDRAFT_129557 [Phlebiopsis gigantea 11061_1 CR5-6]
MHSTPGAPQNIARPPSRQNTPRNDENELLSIDSSVLQGRVHFRRPSIYQTIHETYGPHEYDRSRIEVTPRRKLSLPHRGDRVYYQNENAQTEDLGASTSRLNKLTARCRKLSIGGGAAPMEDSDDDDDDAAGRALAFRRGRCMTPLPSVFMEDSDSDDQGDCTANTRSGEDDAYSPSLTDVSASDGSDSSSASTPAGLSLGDRSKSYFEIIPPQQGPRRRPRHPRATHERVPSLNRDSSSSDDSSEGPLSPRQDIPTGQGARSSWKSDLRELDSCLDGF